MFLLIKKHTDTIIEHTRSLPQETLEFTMKKQVETFSFNPPINLVEEEKWLLAVTSFEATNSVIIMTNENKNFSITIPGHWNPTSAEKTIHKLNKLLEPLSQNDIDLRVEQIKKETIFLNRNYSCPCLGIFKKNTWRIKKTNYNDLEDMVNRMQLTNDEIIDILDLKYIPSKKQALPHIQPCMK